MNNSQNRLEAAPRRVMNNSQNGLEAA
ncbi:hypothetical protein SAMN05216409_12223, partial [Pseudomonas lutea]